MPRLPPLPHVRAVEAAVRLSSIGLAARELNLTDGAVSKAVREFERDLGFALFERRARAIVPTALARNLAHDLRQGIDRIAAGVERARAAATGSRPLTLSCEPTFLIRWLIPRLAELEAAIGDRRDLRLVSAGGAVPFAAEAIDVAIRRADFPIDEGLVAKPFRVERVGPVCRPGAFVPGTPTTLLHTRSRPDAWATWRRLSGEHITAHKEIEFEHFYQSLQAATAGAGVAIGPEALVADDLAAGALTAPFGFVADGTSYVLLAPEGTIDDMAFGRVVAWLVHASGNGTVSD